MAWFQNLDATAIVALVVVISLVGALLSWLMRTAARHAVPPPQTVAHGPQAIATISERGEISPGGQLCLMMLILTQIGIAIAYNGAISAPQQAVVLIAWVGANVLWGIGVVVGRRRHYTVYRAEAPKVEP